MFLKILEKIKEFDSIIIHRHERPDGDCIGTQMGVYHLIKANFPNKCVYTTGDELPDYLARYGHVDNVTDEMYENALKEYISMIRKSNEDKFNIQKIIDPFFMQEKFYMDDLKNSILKGLKKASSDILFEILNKLENKELFDENEYCFDIESLSKLPEVERGC